MGLSQRFRDNWPLAAILAAFLLLGVAYSVVNPLHEATDELRHYRFVRHIVDRGSLPVQGELACSTQAHHPPLYYAAAALVTAAIDTGRDICSQPENNPFWAYRYWEVGRDNKNQYIHRPDEAFPWQGEALAAHLSRLVNVLIGAAAVALTWATARAIWPEDRSIATGSAAFIAFNPMFLYMAAAINNDVIAALAGAAITLASVRLLLDERGLRWQWGLVLGGLFGLALLSKFNLAAIIVVIEAAVTWVAWRRKQWREWLVVNALIGGVALLLAGWWFWRNQMLYGEPTGFERLTELWGVRNPTESFGLAVSELPYAWTSLWGRFGYGQIPMPVGIYIGLGIVALLASAGYGVAVLRGGAESIKSVAAPLAVLALNVAVFFGVLFNYLLVSPAGPMGRFFFPALPSLAILMFFGLRLWWPEGHQIGRRLAWVANGAMALLSLVALFGYIAPAYARPPTFDTTATLPNPIDAQFDTLVALRGYDLSPGTVQPSEAIYVDLYWEVTGRPPGDYLLFVHLIDNETGAVIAQRDTVPGLGNFPSSQWQPGDTFVESLSLVVPETAYVPAASTLQVGLYAPDAYRLGITDATTGEGLGDAYPLATIFLDPLDNPEVPNAGDYNFERQLRLAGYEYGQRVLSPGDFLDLTLYGQALQAVLEDHVIHINIRDAADRPLASQSVQPNDWTEGETAVTRLNIPLPADTAAGPLSIVVTVEDTAEGRLLNRIHPNGSWIADRLELSPVVVRP